MYRQHKADKKAVEVAIKQEKLAQEQFDKQCRDNPKSKFKGDFQAYMKEQNVWPYPTLDAKARWNMETPRPVNALDMQGRKVGFGSWTTASTMTTLVRSSMLHKDTRSACARLI